MDFNGYLFLKITFIVCGILIFICRSCLFMRKYLKEPSSVNEDQRRIPDDYFNNKERRFVLVHPV
jgi:hypothetical protein